MVNVSLSFNIRWCLENILCEQSSENDVPLSIHGLSSISILAQVEVVRLKFLSKNDGHLLLLVLGNFTIFPDHYRVSSVSILAQVEVVRLKFLSKNGGHLPLLVLGNFTIFPVHSVG